jgi:hypothetical protein
MEFYKPRKVMFKAWNKETKLLMRLNSIDCKKGELFKKDHILLQFTGLYDQQDDEIYEMDIMLMASEKYIVVWDDERNGWNLAKLNNAKVVEPFLKTNSKKTTRLWSYFESEKKA